MQSLKIFIVALLFTIAYAQRETYVKPEHSSLFNHGSPSYQDVMDDTCPHNVLYSFFAENINTPIRAAIFTASLILIPGIFALCAIVFAIFIILWILWCNKTAEPSIFNGYECLNCSTNKEKSVKIKEQKNTIPTIP